MDGWMDGGREGGREGGMEGYDEHDDDADDSAGHDDVDFALVDFITIITTAVATTITIIIIIMVILACARWLDLSLLGGPVDAVQGTTCKRLPRIEMCRILGCSRETFCTSSMSHHALKPFFSKERAPHDRSCRQNTCTTRLSFLVFRPNRGMALQGLECKGCCRTWFKSSTCPLSECFNKAP